MGLAAALFSREVGLGRVMLMERHRLAWAASGGAGGALARFSLTLYRQFAQEWDDGGLLREAPGLLLFLEGPPAGLRRWPQVELLDAAQVADLVPQLVSMPAALVARNQTRVHPLRLAAALARRAGPGRLDLHRPATPAGSQLPSQPVRPVKLGGNLRCGSPCPPPRAMMTSMPDVPVRLRPIGKADLDLLSRFDTDPSSRGPYLASGFRSPQARWRRWQEDGWLGADSGQLAVTLPDGTLAGIVAWRSIQTGGPEGGCLEIGALLFPEHRGRGFGTAAQRLLVEYLFATTLANRLQAITNVENIAEQKAPERIGFSREGVMRGLAFDGGRWHDAVLYARLRDDTR
jgi:ribosomal-protein-alanine N-acetyltransferase